MEIISKACAGIENGSCFQNTCRHRNVEVVSGAVSTGFRSHGREIFCDVTLTPLAGASHELTFTLCDQS